MNKIKIAVIIIINLILQTTLFSRINVWEVHPNLSLPVIVGLAIYFGANVGGYCGLVIGLIEDILFSPIVGSRALLYFLIGFFIGDAETGVNKDDIRTGSIFTAVATVAYFLLYHLVLLAFGQQFQFVQYLKGPLWLELAMNTGLYFIIYLVFQRLFTFPKFKL